MSEADIIKTISCVRFAENNDYRYGMDMRFFRSIPSDVDFYPVKEMDNGLIQFVADGYGAGAGNNIQGSYGSGSIYVFGSDISHLLGWVRGTLESGTITAAEVNERLKS